MPNIYPFGQCTWGAANLCNWVMRYGNLQNAKEWAAGWRDHGGFVGMTPAVGTVACFQPGDNQADAVFGHVAVVVEVVGKGFRVDEMNGPAGPGHYDLRWCYDDPGVSFLHENDPTPPPTPTPPIPTPIPQGEPVFIAQNPQQGDYLVFDNGLSVPIGASTTVTALVAALKPPLPVVNVDPEFITGLKAILARP
jgi:hypothetical protein